ncbi:putative oxidoreductase, 2OG-Fe(II) oxygenase family [Aspergillus rambellii]|uniref:Putative oxidoreductase, 2OG-Fe(II) oxygenase family n=1 Tax=Aspergillus rambellii TaxID=308745 RepID=A0A0F8V438_9EURO|nr:putative oxidoreductase, 2OG-Fe(II) oxygenase family [Aspergillus rambellii]
MSDTTSVGPPIQLPVLDISNPNDPAVGKAMLDAATKYGFLYVDSKGTDFTAEDVQRAFDQSKAFFASPAQDKETCRIQSNNRGWSGMHTETLDPEHQRTGDFKEAMNFGEFKDGKAQQPLPPSLAPQETQIGHFAELCNKTCARILKLLALGLQIPDDFFTSRHDSTQGPTGCILRYLYYPSISRPETSSYKHDIDVRAGAHSDYGSITLLFQRPGQPGLEILTSHEEGTWAPVPVQPWASADASADEETSRTQHHHHAFPPPILVNIGDLLSYWTDGLLKSTVHRVVFPLSEQRSPSPSAEDRYSIAFFCHPLDATELVPVPSEVVRVYREERGERGLRPEEKVGFGGGAGGLEPGRRALTASEHLMSRLNATYSFREGGSSAAAAAAAA